MNSINLDAKQLYTSIEVGHRDDDYAYLAKTCLRYLSQYTKYALQNNVSKRDYALIVLKFYRSFIENEQRI